MRSDKEIEATNQAFVNAFSYGEDAGISWLKSTVHTLEDQRAVLLDKQRRLITLFLAGVKRPLTVEEARLCSVCRVCRQPEDGGNHRGFFYYGYGNEHAHESCLDQMAPSRVRELEGILRKLLAGYDEGRHTVQEVVEEARQALGVES